MIKSCKLYIGTRTIILRSLVIIITCFGISTSWDTHYGTIILLDKHAVIRYVFHKQEVENILTCITFTQTVIVKTKVTKSREGCNILRYRSRYMIISYIQVL